VDLLLGENKIKLSRNGAIDNMEKTGQKGLRSLQLVI